MTLIRLRGCIRAGWSAPLLFTNPKDRFSRFEAHIILSYFSAEILHVDTCLHGDIRKSLYLNISYMLGYGTTKSFLRRDLLFFL